MPPPPGNDATSNINTLIQRVAGSSVAEIENLIAELENLRELLHAEGQRVLREISGYAPQPGRHEVDAHDRRQCRPVETHDGKSSRQLIIGIASAPADFRACAELSSRG